MGVEVSIKNDNSKKIIKDLHERVLDALDSAGMQASTLARLELQNNPSRIDTGLLRNSITHAVCGKSPSITSYNGSKTHTAESKSAVRRGLVGKPAPEPRSGTYSGSAPNATDDSKQFVLIGTNVEYAPYVHEGTDRMAPNRFLKNAIQKNKAELSDIIKKVLQDFQT